MNHPLPYAVRTILVALLCSSFALPALAQSTTEGAVSGTVYDVQGAVVPHAQITVVSNATQLTQTLNSDARGFYHTSTLQPGQYTVTIEAPGFNTYRAEHVIVEVGRATNIEPKLAVGASSETVSVSAEAPLVNTDTPDFANNVNQAQINNLPINGRRWSNFALLTPGVVSDQNGFGLLSFRGISVLLNNNTIDGADNNQAYFSEERGRTRASYSTSQFSVREFQVNTSNYSAEYGRAAGGVVNTVTKSGSNELHGQIAFYDRDNSWGATNPFTTLTTLQNGNIVTAPYKPEDRRLQYAFGIGGKIIRDRLFWFYTFDQQSRRFPGTARAGNPGVFFAAPDAASTCTGTQNTATQGACSLQRRFKYAAYAQGAAQYNQGLDLLSTFLGPVPRKGDQTINFPKLDWIVNSNNRASISYNRLRWDSPAGIQTQASNTLGIASFGNDFVKEDWGIARLNTTFGARVNNELRYQYGRDFEYENTQKPSPNELPLANNQFGRPANISIAGGSGFQIGAPQFLERAALPDERRNQIADTVSWVRGNHVLKFGIDYNHVYDYISNLFNEHGAFNYNNIADFLTDYDSATLGLNLPSNYSSYSQAFGPRRFAFATQDYAVFASDDWKVTPRLSLTLGLRYEYEQLPDAFLPNSDLPLTRNVPADKNNLGPRVGFAYDVFGDGKTVVRGGYGIYYGRIINGTIFSVLTGSGATGSQTNYFFAGPSAAGAPAFPNIIATQPNALVKPNAIFFDHNFQNPQVHETDLVVEQDLGWNTIVSASYLGSYGRQLPNFIDTNIDLGTLTQLTYSIYDPTGAGPLPNGSAYVTNLFTNRTRLNPNFGQITDALSNINSKYNALVGQLNHHFDKGLQFNASYTWAHAEDFGQNQTTGSLGNAVADPTNFKAEFGNSSFDVRNRFVFNTVYQPGYRVGGKWLGYLLNDYTLSPIFQYQTGLPYTLSVNGSAGQGLGGINGSNGTNRIIPLGRNSYRYPNDYNLDLHVSKRIPITEKYRLEILGEAFNILNHQNITGVNTTGYTICTKTTSQGCGGTGATSAAPVLAFSPTFGTITNSNSNLTYRERQIQIAVRFEF